MLETNVRVAGSQISLYSTRFMDEPQYIQDDEHQMRMWPFWTEFIFYVCLFFMCKYTN
jgi:hypothetical protein